MDVIILAFDGAWRSGATAQEIISAIVAKQTKNEGRTWPHWSTMPADKAIEHDRSGENHIGDANKMVGAPVAAAPVDPSKLGAAMRAFDDAGGHAISYAPAWMRKALEAASTPAAPGIDLAEMVKSNLRSIKRMATALPISHVSAANIVDEANHAMALIDASPKGDARQDDRFPGGFADAIAYADEMEEGAGRLYEQVIGFEDGGHTGTDMLAAVLRELQASPKGGSTDAQDAARYRWLRDEAISFPYDVEIASPWCVFGMNTAGAEINPIDGTKLDAAIDAARQFAEDNQPQATSAEVGA